MRGTNRAYYSAALTNTVCFIYALNIYNKIFENYVLLVHDCCERACD